MLVEEALAKYLAEKTGVKVWPEQIPANEAEPVYPAIVYQEISYVPDVIHRGASGIASTRYQITCFARRYRESRELAERARQRLSGFRGAWGELDIDGCFVEDARSVPELDAEASSRDRFGRMFDVVICFKESPTVS